MKGVIAHQVATLVSVSYTHLDVYKRQGQTFDRIVIYRKRGTQPFTLSGGSSSEIAHDTLISEQIVTDTLLVGHYVTSAQVTAPASSVWYGASLERSSGCLLYTSRCV